MKEENEALKDTRQGELLTSWRKVFMPSKDKFSIPAQTALNIIGYSEIKYLLSVLRTEFTEDLDWQINPLGETWLTEACFHELVIVARPKRGALVESLPEILIVERDRMYKSQQVRQNSRFGGMYSR